MSSTPFNLFSTISALENILLGSEAHQLLHDGINQIRPFLSDVFHIPVNISETSTTVIVQAQLPGFDKSQVKIRTEGHVLNISAEHKESTQETQSHSEFNRGPFQRSVKLPLQTDIRTASASMNNGLLEVKFAKLPEAESGEIVIN